MSFEIVIPQEQAEKEVSDYLDIKMIFPKQRERMEPVINEVVEAIMYGLVSINKEDGKIKQTLLFPLDTLKELIYAADVDGETMSKNLAGKKADTMSARNLVYIMSYTGQLAATINKLKPRDRNTADNISLFFQ